MAGISIIHFPPTASVLLTATERNCQSGLQCRVLPRAAEGVILASPENPKDRNCSLSPRASDTFPSPAYLVAEICSGLRLACPAGKGSKSIRRTIAPNSRLVRWFSASNSQ